MIKGAAASLRYSGTCSLNACPDGSGSAVLDQRTHPGVPSRSTVDDAPPFIGTRLAQALSVRALLLYVKYGVLVESLAVASLSLDTAFFLLRPPHSHQHLLHLHRAPL